ncbi:hypothetical protein SDC9_202066 [bioreactor metagenome]|uniref:Uncharacterized protein n=1 Tax=bioreactor metagenome TaxID=1076179 RepID=A0A645ITA4_9ZZZZ
MGRAFFQTDAFATFLYANCVIDNCQVILQFDRFVRAVFHTQAASDTGHFAELLHHRAFIMRAAIYGDMGIKGDHVDDMLRAGGCAFPAARTFFLIHNRQTLGT